MGLGRDRTRYLLFIVTSILGFCNCSMFCCALLCAYSSFASIAMGNGELFALLCLSSWCLVIVVLLFLAMPRVCLQFVIVVFLILLTYYLRSSVLLTSLWSNIRNKSEFFSAIAVLCFEEMNIVSLLNVTCRQSRLYRQIN